ncbi:hypothetical protein [Roseisolibacter sp. H3M3-2]|uniref:hypothetical protein n=1 Tax=Roseisolibacter sp. H3M3-2 TaxID=3031323 RepID=UPI0023D9830D|nr:hypothetical protein [Roseisolibacter sp. H3M3-2]MDF1503753.1 hypothetical protein [Roseisolibacter sp. H3M3-2]
MSIDRSPPDLDRAPDAPWVRRAAARDAVLRGLVHALSNRVGTVSAVASMLDPGAPAAAAATAMLQGEAERLEALLEEFRRFAGEPGGGAEPLHLPDLVALAAALHAHHPMLRDVPCALPNADALPPAYADPAAVLDALLVALDAAKGAAGADGVRIAATTDADALRLRVAPVEPDAPPDATLTWALVGGAGEGGVGPVGGGVTLPTLGAARRVGGTGGA